MQIEVLTYTYPRAPPKITKNLHFVNFDPLDQVRAQVDPQMEFEIMIKSFISNQKNSSWSFFLAAMSSRRWAVQAQDLVIYKIKSFF